MNLLDFIFPKRCLGCGRVGKYFCFVCSAKIRRFQANESICPVCEKAAIDGVTHPKCRGRYTLDGLTSFFHYEGVVQKALKAIKYRYVSDIAEELLQKIPLTSHIIPTTFDHSRAVFVPVPLHKNRFRYRGFNQAAIFAQKLAKYQNLPIVPKMLVRTKFTIPQVEVKLRENRLKNMDGVFAVFPGVSVAQYPSIFLVDDVFTTGATMRAATNVLKRAGVKTVWGISIAR